MFARQGCWKRLSLLCGCSSNHSLFIIYRWGDLEIQKTHKIKSRKYRKVPDRVRTPCEATRWLDRDSYLDFCEYLHKWTKTKCYTLKHEEHKAWCKANTKSLKREANSSIHKPVLFHRTSASQPWLLCMPTQACKTNSKTQMRSKQARKTNSKSLKCEAKWRKPELESKRRLHKCAKPGVTLSNVKCTTCKTQQ